MQTAPHYNRTDHHELPQMRRLLAVMARLRDPNGGCPWDLEQDFASIARYTIEEAYEVVEAIHTNDMASLRDELGDLLLQVVFHSQMANEQALFDFESVAQAIADKMIRRHPHVFADLLVADGKEVHANWEAIKQQERAGKSAQAVSVLADIPRAFPALMRAEKLQTRASQVGFDWPDPAPVMGKIAEELQEFSQAESADHRAEELGDLLFAVVNLARHHRIDPEQALSQANAKFERRFGHVEAKRTQSGKAWDDTSLDEMESWWKQAKQEEV